MVIVDGAGRDLTDTQAALGQMIFWAGSFETALRFTSELLARGEQERDALVRLTVGPLMKETKKYASRRPEIDEGMRRELAAIVTAAKPHVESRNVYIHGGWAEPPASASGPTQ